MSAYELTKTILKDSANLKAYYRFESGNLTVDSSGNSRTLTAIGTPTEDASGVYGGAVAYASASSQAHSAVDHADFKPTGSFSFSAWVKSSSAATTRAVFQSYSENTAVAGILIRISASDKLDVFVGKNTGTVLNTDYKQLTSSTSVATGSWVHVVVTYDGSTIRIYVNGKHDNSVASTINPAYAATNYVRVGCQNSSGTNITFFNGSIDDLAFFNGTALSADQIKELYEGRYIGEWMPQSGLVGLWHLNGNSTDSSGNNRHGTDTAITYSLANGKIAQGAGFNNTTSAIAIGAKIIPTGAKTIACWFKSANPDNYRAIINENDISSSRSGTGFYTVQTSGVARLIITYSSAGNFILNVVGNTNICDGVRRFLVFTWDGTTGANAGKIYINGKVDSTATATNTESATPSDNCMIGRGSTLADYFINGSLDELAIFSRALTAAEIRKWYAWSVGRYL